MKNPSLIALPCILVFASASYAAIITQDFESLGVGTSATPSGWSYININGGNNAYVTVAGDGGGVGAQITGDNNTNALHPPGSYLVNSGSTAFDLTSTITGSFRYYVTVADRASGGDFIFGDIKTGLSVSGAGEYLGLQMMNDSFGNRGGVIDSAGSQVANFTGNQVGLDWYTINFTWTPTSGTTGNFTASGTGTSKSWTVSYDGYTFTSNEAYFGFGAGDYYNTAQTVIYDNISITGSIVPEPSTHLLGLIGVCLLLRRRKIR